VDSLHLVGFIDNLIKVMLHEENAFDRLHGPSMDRLLSNRHIARLPTVDCRVPAMSCH